MNIQEQLRQIHEETYKIEVECLDSNIWVPNKAHPSDAGFDIYAPYDFSIAYGAVVKIPLGIRMALPIGSWARIETKSGLGSKGMLVFAGVIDRNYRGEVHLIATNLQKDTTIQILRLQKCAQMTMNPHSEHFYIEKVLNIDTNTDRGTGGFGSSGA